MPAHIFGNMWSQSWAAIYDHVVPYPNAGVRPDATEGPGNLKVVDQLWWSRKWKVQKFNWQNWMLI